MKNGDISNVPAPLRYFDGSSFLEKKMFGTFRVKKEFLRVTEPFYREHTVILWFDPEWLGKRKISVGDNVLKPIVYNSLISEPLRGLIWTLRKKRTKLITDNADLLVAYPESVIYIGLPISKLLEEA
jgi:hypothetical protein